MSFESAGYQLLPVLPELVLAAGAMALLMVGAYQGVRTTGEEISSVTVSVGVAQFRMGESADRMIERCDRALYQAKRSGRNCVVKESVADEEIAA